MMQTIFFSAAILLVCMFLATNAQLRGKTVEELRNTPIRAFDKVKGKTLRELGVEKPRQPKQYKPRQLENQVVSFFAVYDEFALKGAPVLGASAGINGFLVDSKNFDTEQIIDEDKIGYLNGACTIVGEPEDHFCTFEIVVSYGDKVGSVVATGSLNYSMFSGGVLTVEAAEDEFSGSTGGVLAVTYVTIGDVNVFAGQLTLTM